MKRLTTIIFEQRSGGLFVLLFSAIAAIAVYHVIPFLAEMPEYLDEARTLASGQRLSTGNFTPVGYPLLLSPFVRLANIEGVIIAQSAVYVLSVTAAWLVLRNSLGQESRRTAVIPLACLLAVALHPYMLLNTHRINDNAFNALLMVAMAAWCWRSFAVPDVKRAVIYGVALGIFVAIRPNALIFALLPFIGFLSPLARKNARGMVPYVAMLFGVAAVTYGIAVASATGSYVFWPSNGAYNLYAGNNPFSFDVLIDHYNAEGSIPPALDAAGISHLGIYAVPQSVYLSLTWQFVSGHIAGFLSLCFTKLIVFFAPRIVHSAGMLDSATQILLSLPALVWVVAVTCHWRAGRKRQCLARLAFVVLYVLPFVITNSDSRFRMPLDIWFILDFAALASWWPQPSSGTRFGPQTNTQETLPREVCRRSDPIGRLLRASPSLRTSH